MGCEDMSFTWEVVAGSSELGTVPWSGRCEFVVSSLGVGKVNADGLDVRNLMKSPMHGEGRVTLSFVNLGHSVRMWSLVSISD